MRYFDVLLPRVVATVYMPRFECTLREIPSKWPDMPFPCVRFIEPFFFGTDERIPELMRGTQGVEEIIIEAETIDADRTGYRVAAKCRYVGDRTVFFPDDYRGKDLEGDTQDHLQIANRFEGFLSDRQHRFIESPTTRQVRRAIGVDLRYKEFIVIDRTSTHYKNAQAIGGLAKTLRSLHAVRGHLRHYASGLVVPVRPHVRGAGDLAQVKDYVVRT